MNVCMHAGMYTYMYIYICIYIYIHTSVNNYIQLEKSRVSNPGLQRLESKLRAGGQRHAVRRRTAAFFCNL